MKQPVVALCEPVAAGCYNPGMSRDNGQPVMILGGGINGAAAARELLLNGVPVWVVDAHDIACGATSRSSRLIHGGLRYLEYGDIGLVRESLAERGRLRRLAPQFVSPLRLHIPLSRRGGGWIRSGLRFLGADRRPWLRRLLASRFCSGPRGLWLVRLGLWLYDRFARDSQFGSAEVVSTTAAGVPQVDAGRYRWQCAYVDGHMLYPERFVIALLEDARRLAEERGVEFRVLTYRHAELSGNQVSLRSTLDVDAAAEVLYPPVIINATGAWGDLTLSQLKRPAPRLFGGTKGSHFLTHHPQLRTALGDGGVYAEADDGRLVFVLPFGSSVLVGTTDERFEGRPEQAVATAGEIEYLLELVGELFPKIGLTRDDVDMHYAGVRPLPYHPQGKAGAIPRGHALAWTNDGPVPVLTLIGGKLTTCRALAEEVVAAVAGRVGLSHIVTSRERVIPGGEDHPDDADAIACEQQQLAAMFRVDPAVIQAVWALCGTCTRAVLEQGGDGTPPGGWSAELLAGTHLPLSFVRQVIEREWVQTLDDLVERRLMLLFRPELSTDCLRALADCLVAAGRLEAAQADHAVEACVRRLRDVYGKRVLAPDPQAAAERTSI